MKEGVNWVAILENGENVHIVFLGKEGRYPDKYCSVNGWFCKLVIRFHRLKASIIACNKSLGGLLERTGRRRRRESMFQFSRKSCKH